MHVYITWTSVILVDKMWGLYHSYNNQTLRIIAKKAITRATTNQLRSNSYISELFMRSIYTKRKNDAVDERTKGQNSFKYLSIFKYLNDTFVILAFMV